MFYIYFSYLKIILQNIHCNKKKLSRTRFDLPWIAECYAILLSDILNEQRILLKVIHSLQEINHDWGEGKQKGKRQKNWRGFVIFK